MQKQFLGELKEHFRLNIYEVKIWTALLSRGIASAAELADISGVPRSRCYDVLESLEKKGFIVMKIGKPIKYIAVQPEEIIERVKKDLEIKSRKQQEFIEKVGGTDIFKELELLHSSGIKHIDVTELSDSIKGRDNINKFIKAMLLRAESSIKIVTSKEGMKRKSKILKKVIPKLKTNVDISIYSEFSDKTISVLPKNIIFNNFRGEFRFIIVDNKELLFMDSDKETKPEFDSGVWVKSPFFVNTLNTMFKESLK